MQNSSFHSMKHTNTSISRCFVLMIVIGAMRIRIIKLLKKIDTQKTQYICIMWGYYDIVEKIN